MYKYLFGPVPSRRLGASLGIDVIPKKVCSLNCVYCEVGRTTELTTERKEYIRYDDIVAELDDYFASGHPDPDYMTFSGSGEPTLNSEIGRIIEYVKGRKPDVPVAVLTNGTLLSRADLRRELAPADVILPSLDAASARSFIRINRPHPSIRLDEYVDGLRLLRDEYKGKIYLEVFVLPGYNMGSDDIATMNDAIRLIRPDRVQVNTLDRPGVLEDLRPASLEELTRFTDAIDYPFKEIIASVQERKSVVSYRNDLETAIVETIARRPCTLRDLTDILGGHVNEINKYLDVLESGEKIEVVRQERGFFYQIASK